MRVFITIGLLASLLLAPLASAQIAVFDAANHVVSSVTAVQWTMSAVEAVIHTAKWIIEQTPWMSSCRQGTSPRIWPR